MHVIPILREQSAKDQIEKEQQTTQKVIATSTVRFRFRFATSFAGAHANVAIVQIVAIVGLIVSQCADTLADEGIVVGHVGVHAGLVAPGTTCHAGPVSNFAPCAGDGSSSSTSSAKRTGAKTGNTNHLTLSI
jgi:hypothetical protein